MPLVDYVKKTVYQQLIFQLYFSYFYRPVERSIPSAYNLPDDVEDTPKEQLVEDGTEPCLEIESNRRLSEPSERKNSLFFSLGPRRSKSSSKSKEARSSAKSGKERKRRLWNSNLPPKSPYLKFYQIFSTLLMIYVLLKGIIPNSLVDEIFDLSRPAHCYALGRFRMFHLEADEIANMFCIYHLIWRAAQYMNRRCLKIDLIMFLLQEERAIYNQYKLTGDSYAVGPSRDAKISVQERFLSSIMYYPVKYKTYTCYKIRPNRTESARTTLIERVAEFTMTTVSIYVVAFCCFAPGSIYTILNDYHYLSSYPGCDPHLEHLNETNQINPWFSVTLTKHRLAAIVVDSIENLVIWLDSGAAMILVLPMSYTLNHDLLIYCQHLYNKLENVLYLLKLDRVHIEELGTLRKEPKRGNLNPLGAPEKLALSKSSGISLGYEKYSYGYPTERRDFSLNGLHTVSRQAELDRLVYQLQAELCDFFYQIESVDMLVSDLMTHAIFIWLATFAYTTYLTISEDKDLAIKIVQGVGFSGFTVVSLFLVRLPRRNKAFHRIICSITALDQSPYKQGFLEILEFYRSRNLSAYTLFHCYPYYTTTYLSIVGYTLSCISVISSLFGTF